MTFLPYEFFTNKQIQESCESKGIFYTLTNKCCKSMQINEK